MSTAIITGVSHHHEQELVSAIEGAAGVTVVRRCADVAELMATGASGVADVAIVSSDFRGLDRDALRHLAGHGVRIAGCVVVGDDAAEARLRQLGVSAMLHPGTDPVEMARVLRGLAQGSTSAPTANPRDHGTRDRDRDRAGSPGVSLPPRSQESGITDADLEEFLADPSGRTALSESGMGSATPGGHGALGDDADGAERESSSRRGRLTAVWGPTGAPGRTTVAVTVAAALAARGVHTLLVDLDTWGASVSQALALIDEAPGIAAAARASEQGTLDTAALARVAPEVTQGLRVLTGIPKPDRWPELRAAAVEDVLEKSRALVQHIVVDCGFAIEDDEELSYDTAAPRRNATTLAALEASDNLLVVGSADPIGLQRLVRAVQDVGVIRSAAPMVIVNKVRASATGPKPEKAMGEVLGRFAGLEDPHFVPWAPQECDDALLEGRSLIESAPSAAVTRAIARLAPLIQPDLLETLESRQSRRRARRVRWLRGGPLAGRRLRRPAGA